MRILLLLPLLLIGCAAPEPDEGAVVAGERTVNAAESVDLDGYLALGDTPMGDGATFTPAALAADPTAVDGEAVRVEGTLAQVCMQKGCWMTLENPGGEPVRVQVPRGDDGDYLWTFPMDPTPRHAVIAGTARADTVSVETLRHLAEDGGRSEAEIAAITEPEFAVVIDATGALLEESPADVQP